DLLLAAHTFDCLVIDLDLQRGGALRLLERLEDVALRPLLTIVQTPRPLTEQEEEALAPHADHVLIVATRSPEQLLGDAAGFLDEVRARSAEDGVADEDAP